MNNLSHIWRTFAPDVGKPQISPLRFAPVEMTKLGLIADQAFIPLGGPQAHEHFGRDDKLGGVDDEAFACKTWVPHIWRTFAPDVGKPQISPLRFAPVEMTKLGLIADQAFIPLGGPQAHEHFGRDDKLGGVDDEAFACKTWVPHIWRTFAPDVGKPQISPLRFAPVEMTKLGLIADQAFIPLGGPQAHEHFGRDDKLGGVDDEAFACKTWVPHIRALLCQMGKTPKAGLEVSPAGTTETPRHTGLRHGSAVPPGLDSWRFSE